MRIVNKAQTLDIPHIVINRHFRHRSLFMDFILVSNRHDGAIIRRKRLVVVRPGPKWLSDSKKMRLLIFSPSNNFRFGLFAASRFEG